MQVYTRILVAIDCSPVDEAIVSHVSVLAQQNKAEVVLLHVIHAHTLDQDRALRTKARKTLAGYKERLQGESVKTTVLLLRIRHQLTVTHGTSTRLLMCEEAVAVAATESGMTWSSV